MSPSVDTKSEADEFDDDDVEEASEEAEDLDVDHLIRSLDRLKRRGTRVSEPAWRRLERYLEEKRTAELLSDFDDYDAEADTPASRRTRRATGSTRTRNTRKKRNY